MIHGESEWMVILHLGILKMIYTAAAFTLTPDSLIPYLTRLPCKTSTYSSTKVRYTTMITDKIAYIDEYASIIEPRHDKTNKMSVRPAKT